MEYLAAKKELSAPLKAIYDKYVKASSNKGASASSYNKPIVSLVNEKLVPYLNAMIIANLESSSNYFFCIIKKYKKY